MTTLERILEKQSEAQAETTKTLAMVTTILEGMEKRLHSQETYGKAAAEAPRKLNEHVKQAIVTAIALGLVGALMALILIK